MVEMSGNGRSICTAGAERVGRAVGFDEIPRELHPQAPRHRSESAGLGMSLPA